MAVPDNGFGWHSDPRPPTPDELVAAQSPYYLHATECFGPERYMFESNLPVGKFSLSYPVLWNGLKKIAAPFSEDGGGQCSTEQLPGCAGCGDEPASHSAEDHILEFGCQHSPALQVLRALPSLPFGTRPPRFL